MPVAGIVPVFFGGHTEFPNHSGHITGTEQGPLLLYSYVRTRTRHENRIILLLLLLSTCSARATILRPCALTPPHHPNRPMDGRLPCSIASFNRTPVVVEALLFVPPLLKHPRKPQQETNRTGKVFPPVAQTLSARNPSAKHHGPYNTHLKRRFFHGLAQPKLDTRGQS